MINDKIITTNEKKNRFVIYIMLRNMVCFRWKPPWKSRYRCEYLTFKILVKCYGISFSNPNFYLYVLFSWSRNRYQYIWYSGRELEWDFRCVDEDIKIISKKRQGDENKRWKHSKCFHLFRKIKDIFNLLTIIQWLRTNKRSEFKVGVFFFTKFL